MERKKASDFPQELLNLFDGYVHGGISRRDFLDRAQKFAVGGVTAAALFQMLKPNYAWALQVPTDDKRIKAEYDTVPSPQGYGSIKGYLARPVSATKLPSILVIHENRGLNPYIEDVARRLAVANFIAFAPDGLTSVGGYPGDDEKGLALFRELDRAKMGEDFFAAAMWLKSRPDSTGKPWRRRLLLRRWHRQSAGGTDGLGSCRRSSVLRSSTQCRRRGQDQGADKRAIRRTRPAYHRRMASLRRRPHAGPGAARGSYLQRRQSRLPQRHDPPVRRSRSQRSLAAYVGLVQ
jgi:hypothetical protein